MSGKYSHWNMQRRKDSSHQWAQYKRFLLSSKLEDLINQKIKVRRDGGGGTGRPSLHPLHSQTNNELNKVWALPQLPTESPLSLTCIKDRWDRLEAGRKPQPQGLTQLPGAEPE